MLGERHWRHANDAGHVMQSTLRDKLDLHFRYVVAAYEEPEQGPAKAVD